MTGGDVIEELDGKQLDEHGGPGGGDQRRATPATPSELTVLRDCETLEIEATLTERTSRS